MKPRRLDRFVLAGLVTLLLASPLLTGCVQVQVTDEGPDAVTPTPYTELATPREARDLAILGIEFNPPLRYEEVVAAGRLELLVAVENRGLSVESRVVVDAQLAGAGESDALVKRSETLESIAPGEVRLVRFDSIGLLPYKETYVMTVSVSAAPGETRTSDNQRVYRLSVSVPSPTPISAIIAP